MKNLLLIPLAAAMLLSACSKYQMSTISAVNAKRDDKTGRFISENDSVKITYSFAGQNAPIHVEIMNKLNQPLYIDWGRSAYIVGQKSFTYGDNNVHIAGDVSGSSYRIGRSINVSDGIISANATLPQNTTFVPPHTSSDKTLINIASQMDTYINETLFTKKRMTSTMTGQDVPVKSADFTVENTPLAFKSYITMYTLDGSTPKFIAFENQFYVSNILQSGLGPENFDNYNIGLGDKFYTSKATATGKVVTGASVAAAVGGLAVLAVDVNRNNR